MNKITKIILWTNRLAAALIMLQTLYFKFSGAPESVYIFTAIGMEPWGRFGIGIGELIASALILIPSRSWMGGLAGMGLMAGAIFFHLTKLGVSVMNDGGQLFAYALIVFICSAVVVYIQRNDAIGFTRRLILKKA